MATDKGCSLIALPTILKGDATHISLVLHPLSGIPDRRIYLHDQAPAAIGAFAYPRAGDIVQVEVPGPDPARGRRHADLPIDPEWLRSQPPCLFLVLSRTHARGRMVVNDLI